MAKIDMLGKVFGRLVVVAEAEKSAGGEARWRCVCECGGVAICRGSALRIGKSTSCGCVRSDNMRALGKSLETHGEASNKTAEFRVWAGARNRCQNPNNHAFARYGGRGISVCNRWDSYENFLSDMGRRPSPKHSLDRIDNDGPYSPENCRWATAIEQSRNRSCSRSITIDGVTKHLRTWLGERAVGHSTFYRRLGRGMTEAQALDHPSPRLLKKTHAKPTNGG